MKLAHYLSEDLILGTYFQSARDPDFSCLKGRLESNTENESKRLGV